MGPRARKPEELRALSGLEPTGWAVEVHTAARLRLAKRPDRFSLARGLVTSVGALATATALALATTQFTGAGFVLWPVAVGLLAVAVLGVLASVRAWRRLRSGVFLDALGDARTITGCPQAAGGLADYQARLRTVGFDELDAIELATFTGGQASVVLTVLLRGGERLEGPSLSSSSPQAPDAAPLRRLADELAALCGCRVRTR